MPEEISSSAGADNGASNERGYYGLPVLKTPVWRWEVWSYFFLGGLASGCFLVASLARLFGDGRDRSISRAGYLISFAAVLACPPLLVKDLGRPGRFLTMLRVFKPESPMSVGVWGLVGFSGCAALAALRELVGDSRRPIGGLIRLVPARGLATLGTILSILLGGYTGVLLSVTSVPLWSRSRLLGPAFLASAVASALSAISLVLAFGHGESDASLRRLNRMKVAASAAEAVALAGFLRSTDRAARPLLDSKQFGYPFLAGAIGLGLIVPLVATSPLSPHDRRSTALAAACALTGGLLLRYSIVEAGRVSAEDPEATFWHTDPRKEKNRQ